MDDAYSVSSYCRARCYIDRELVSLTKRPANPEGKRQAALDFYASLGNPQRCAPAIQVAGTSGKGSICYYLARILWASGFRTGLHVSPYLQVATEKTWTDGRYAGGEAFWEVTKALQPVLEPLRWRPGFPASVHGLASLGVSLELLRREEPDWLVMETGLGGRYDLVQGLRREVSVITDIGLDHQESLGSTLESIAWHKAGIMEGAKVALAVYDPRTWPIFQKEARRTGCQLVAVNPGEGVESRPASTVFTRPHLGKVEIPGLPGKYEERNMSVALWVADTLVHRGVAITPQGCLQALANVRFPGRLERMPGSVPVVLDGAHNPQKMSALGASLPPDLRNAPVLLMGVSGHRDPVELVKALGVRPGAVVCLPPRLYGKWTPEAEEMVALLKGTSGSLYAATCPAQAMALSLDLARRHGAGVLVTGSLYTVGEIRHLWYPWQQVLRSRCSWCKDLPEQRK